MCTPVRAVLAAIILSMALWAAGCSGKQAANVDVPLTPSKYGASGTSGFGFDHYQRLGQVYSEHPETDASVPFEIAKVTDTQGRGFQGAVLVERHAEDDPEIPESERPLFAFYEDFRFEQWPFGSAEEAATTVAYADTSDAVGIEMGRWVEVRGHDAYMIDRITPDQDIDGRGRPSGVHNPISSIIWAEGNMIYKVSSEEGVPTGLLMKVAASVNR